MTLSTSSTEVHSYIGGCCCPPLWAGILPYVWMDCFAHTNAMFRSYEWLSVFELVPNLLADVEPELCELDCLLDDDGIFQRVKAILS